MLQILSYTGKRRLVEISVNCLTYKGKYTDGIEPGHLFFRGSLSALPVSFFKTHLKGKRDGNTSSFSSVVGIDVEHLK